MLMSLYTLTVRRMTLNALSIFFLLVGKGIIYKILENAKLYKIELLLMILLLQNTNAKNVRYLFPNLIFFVKHRLIYPCSSTKETAFDNSSFLPFVCCLPFAFGFFSLPQYVCMYVCVCVF